MSSAHGSDANAGCPSACVMMVSGARVCDCFGVSTDRTGITLIDGIIPMLDVSQLNWAAQPYTATSTQNNWNIDFYFADHFMLRQVDLYILICPSQMIPNEGLISVRVYQSIIFPNAVNGLLFGNVTLTVELHNCTDLIEIAIPTSPLSMHIQYLLEFSMENSLGKIYIGEISFRDEIAMVMSSKLS